MAKLEYTFKTDTLFKMLFVKHIGLLKQLVSELLGIRLESIGEFQITNPEMPPESLGDKFCRLDINMTVNKQRVDLELQVRNEGDYPERTLFNWARLYSTALPAGGDYIDLPRTVIINIINFNLFECEEYYSEFRALETTRHTALTDKMSLYFFELNKLPQEVGADDMRLLWLSLFRADTEEELAKIESMEVSVMEQAIQAYHQITADSEFREKQRLWEKARHDEASALRHARDEEKLEIARKMKEMGFSNEQIQTATSLPAESMKQMWAVMEQAIQAYHQITADSEFREMERLREMARHNEASALRHARDEEKLEIAKNMMKHNRPIDVIIEDTGLTREEVENLK